MLKMCLNWKVLAGLAAVAVGIYFIAPGAFAAAAPVLFLAACPLSMIVMMRMMSNGSTGNGDAGASPGATTPAQAATGDESHAPLERVQARQTAVADQLEAVGRGERLDA